MSTYSDLILATPGLVAYWPLTDTATPAVDAFSTHDGTVTGATLGATGILPNDPEGTACSFDADDERITIGTDAAFATDAVSLEAWFLWTGVWAQDRPVASRRVSGGGVGGWTFQSTANSGSYHWYINASGSWFGPLTTTGWTADTVWHLVATYSNAAGFAVYRNGVLLDSIGDTPGVINTPADCVLEIGRAAGVSASHRGTIAHVSIYDTALSAATVLAHYDAGVTAAVSSRINQQFQLRPY